MAEDPADKSEVVHYREEQRILTIVDRVAKSKGSDRSTIIRESIRFWLGYNSHLTDQEKKDLGVNGQTK